MKKLVFFLLVLSWASLGWTAEPTLKSWSCNGGDLCIFVEGVGELSGLNAKVWLFKNQYLKFADYTTRKYPYTLPALSELETARLVPSNKFSRWIQHQTSRLASRVDGG